MKLFLAIGLTLVAAVSGGLATDACTGACGNQGSRRLCMDVCASKNCNWNPAGGINKCTDGRASFKATSASLRGLATEACTGACDMFACASKNCHWNPDGGVNKCTAPAK